MTSWNLLTGREQKAVEHAITALVRSSVEAQRANVGGYQGHIHVSCWLAPLGWMPEDVVNIDYCPEVAR